MKYAIRLTTPLSLILMIACGPESPEHCACTTDFRAVQILVIAPVGAPVPVDSVEVTLVRTSEILRVAQPGLHAGVVNIVDDSSRARLEPSGDTVRVTVTAAARSAAVDMVVGVDQPCQCHVFKVSGPNFVVLR